MLATLAVLLCAGAQARSPAQGISTEPVAGLSRIDALGLSSTVTSKLKDALGARDYVAAEKLLLAELALDGRSPRAAKILAFAGSVYFMDADYLNASIAWNKSAAISPLPPELSLSLSMAYIRMGRPAWAQKRLEALAAQYPKEAIYPYWLGRIAYDAHAYDQAIPLFRRAVALAPAMSQGYDGLGLCYYFLNQNALAVETYRKAIELQRAASRPSPWPYINLATVLEFMSQPGEAEENLREAIKIDPGIAPAHFQLGIVLEGEGRLEAAVPELKEAARLDNAYAEPHFALARIYRKLHQSVAAQDEVSTYLRLHHEVQGSSAATQPRQP